jgi:hypothetical protein
MVIRRGRVENLAQADVERRIRSRCYREKKRG